MDSGKFWHRRRLRTTRLAVLCVVALCGAAWAQPGAEGNAAAGVATLETFLSDVHTLTAGFKQELWTADHRLLQTETGTLSLRRPNRFRWIYAQPTQLTIVADAKKLWIYDVELAQVTVAPLDSTAESTPAMLLSGDRNVRDGFDVVQAYKADGLDWIKLAPKKGGTDFSSISIGFNGKAPQRLELVDGLNQVTRIELENLVINPDVADSTFEFKPPAGVDVIGGEG
ncbi:MAG: outer membrane lipoprotein chaperone LolA [Gammaproteobacteria bacterium]